MPVTKAAAKIALSIFFLLEFRDALQLGSGLAYDERRSLALTRIKAQHVRLPWRDCEGGSDEDQL